MAKPVEQPATSTSSSPRAKRTRESNERAALAKRALDTGVPITEWDRLSPASRVEIEHLSSADVISRTFAALCGDFAGTAVAGGQSAQIQGRR